LAEGLAQGSADCVPAGWAVRRLAEGPEALGWLVIGECDGSSPLGHEVLDALCGLMSGQLKRASLLRTVLAERRATLRHRIVMDAGVSSSTLLAEARRVGLHLAEFYWPALLVCRRGELVTSTLTQIALAWDKRAPVGSFVVPSDGSLALLYAEESMGARSRLDVERAVCHAVQVAAAEGTALDAQAIIAELSVPIERLQAEVRLLRSLRRYPTRAPQDPPLMHARNFALDRLLEQLDRPSQQRFVNQCLGKLIAFDDRHGSMLAETLELALEHPRRDAAARAGYMHRNTFRRRLQQALVLVDADLDDPDQRLALHIALRLHRLSADSSATRRA
jgi:sugar diacid utilization regulator